MEVWNKLNSKTLVNGGAWDDVKTTVQAATFQEMLKLATPIVEHYQSDLYHDALWINEMITGPMQFDWIARESGTWIGDVVASVRRSDMYEVDRKFRFEILTEGEYKNKWNLNVYEAVPFKNEPHCNHDSVAIVNGECECGIYLGLEEDPLDVSCTGYKGSTGIEHDRGVSCPVHVHETLSVEDCELATTAAGCIWHPAPVAVVEKKAIKFETTTEADKEEILNFLFNPPRPAIFGPADGTANYEDNFPTPRNNDSVNLPDTKRKVNNMYDLINDLREKLEAAQNAREELSEAKYDIDSAVDDLDTYVGELADLISTLDSLPEVSVSVILDVDFES